MSHEITIRENGVAEFCFTGNRDQIWHGLGAELQKGAPIEDWVVSAGMDWDIESSPVKYSTIECINTFEDRRVLYRSDNYNPISIVGKDYKIVQPREVLEFFRDLTTLHGMTLSAAGTLFGGKKFWATADVGHQFEAVTGDNVNGQLLFVTSADGTIANTVKLVSTRTICNNTLTVALNEKTKQVIKTSHRSQWNPSAIKLNMGLINETWEKFSDFIKKLGTVKIKDSDAIDYLQNKFYTPNVLAEDQSTVKIREVATLFEMFKSGTGADYAPGTAWNLLNAVTEKYTHGTGKRDASHQFMNAMLGSADKIKSEVLNDMFALYLKKE